MRLIKNAILSYYSDTIILCSSSNESRTEESILDMGQRLAYEVDSFINDNCPLISKLSFIGHSLGGLIIRAALLHLDKYQD